MSDRRGFGAVYEELGARPLINAAGTKTRLGGGRMAEAVLHAMQEAAKASVGRPPGSSESHHR